MDLLLLAVGAVLVNNFVLSRFLGICPFLGVSKQFGTIETTDAPAMSFAPGSSSHAPPGSPGQ